MLSEDILVYEIMKYIPIEEIFKARRTSKDWYCGYLYQIEQRCRSTEIKWYTTSKDNPVVVRDVSLYRSPMAEKMLGLIFRHGSWKVLLYLLQTHHGARFHRNLREYLDIETSFFATGALAKMLSESKELCKILVGYPMVKD